MKADLHIHTTYSDGVLTVNEVIEKAIANNIDIIAITDHDCLLGALLSKSINNNKIKVITGVEISSYYNNETVHILGYFPDTVSIDNIKKINDILEDVRIKRVARAKEIALRLKKYFNIDLDLTNLLRLTSITRGSIAREIIHQGYNYTLSEIFSKMIGNNCICYIPSTKMETREAINIVHNCGGLAVLAHPILLKKNNPLDIIKLNCDGIEAIYPKNIKGSEKRFRKIALNNELFITAGSDFHEQNDFKHGNIGDVYLEKEDLNKFLEMLK